MNSSFGNSTANLLRAENIVKRYGAGSPVVAGLGVECGAGTALGLVGPNGSGKTTFLRMLAVTSYPTSGAITYNGVNVHEHPHTYLAHLGVVGDASDLPHYLTATELLEWILRARGRWNPESRLYAEGILDRLALDERRLTLIGTYSSGMLKKAQIAAAMAARPDVLLMDEPFRGLDRDSTAEAIVLLREFRDAGGILIISSHVESTLDPICQRYLEFPIR